MTKLKPESDKSKEAARKLERNDDEVRQEERRRVLMKHKSADGNPEEEAGRDSD